MTPCGAPSAAFQRGIVLALSPEAIWAPSGRQATDSTSPAWPPRSRIGVPAARSQTLTVRAEAAAALLPSGLGARACTPAGWSVRFLMGPAPGISQILAVLS